MTVERATAEAKEVIQAMKGYKFDYPIAFDVEDKSQSKLSKALLTDITKAFCDEIKKAGWIENVGAGKGAVGITFEKLLNIEKNITNEQIVLAIKKSANSKLFKCELKKPEVFNFICFYDDNSYSVDKINFKEYRIGRKKNL